MTIRLIIIALALLGAMTIASGPRGVGAQEAPAAQQAGVNLNFPWDGGDSWRYIWGPHAGNSNVLTAVDLQPPEAVGQPCGFQSDSWVVAAADGRVINLQNAIEIDHGNGFRTGYFHLGDKQVTAGYVRAGDRLGRPDCCPEGGEPFDCYSETPHVHFYTTYHGAKQDIHGLNIQGWVLGADDCFQSGRDDRCVGAMLQSTAPPPNDVLPSARADVAIVLDGSDQARDAAHMLLGALVNGDRAAIWSYGSSVKQLADLAPLGPTHPQAINDAIPGPGDPARGLSAACALLSGDAGPQARAVVAIGGGWHAGDVLNDALPCFAGGGPKLFVYDTSGALHEEVRATLSEATIPTVEMATVRDFPCEFQRLRSLISEDAPGACSSFILRAGQVVAMPFVVAEGQTGATFSVRWTAPGAGTADHLDVRPVLLNTTGERATPASKSVTVISGLTHKTYSVSGPAPGGWKLYVSADGLPADGLTVRLTSTSAAPPASGAPVATYEPTPSVSPVDEPSPTETTIPADSPTPPPPKTVIPKKPTPTPSKATPTPDPTPEPTPVPTDTPASLPPPKPEPAPVP